MPKFTTMERISLRNSKEINEKMIQDYIFENPACLGLGDLTALTKEKTQPSGGRLDLLMMDDADTRYEIELQLGDTDPSHIIRTIEYWDTERKRYQKYDHVAVIIAEHITGRFMNVIQLFNGNIPVIAMQVAAYKLGDEEFALVFTKVLDRISVGDDEEEFEPTDRKYWESRSTVEQLKVVDEVSAKCDALKDYEIKYNKFYIGLTKKGIATNPITFRPRKKYTDIMFYRVSEGDGFEEKLADSGLTYDFTTGRSVVLKVRLDNIRDYTKNKELLDEIAALAVANKE